MFFFLKRLLVILVDCFFVAGFFKQILEVELLVVLFCFVFLLGSKRRGTKWCCFLGYVWFGWKGTPGSVDACVTFSGWFLLPSPSCGSHVRLTSRKSN